MNSLQSISPIDGRYRKFTEPLAEYFSEAALIRYRVMVEAEYLIALSESGETGLRKFSAEEKTLLRKLYELATDDAQIVSDIEKQGYKNIPATNHDVKAVEYFMKDRLADTSLKDSLEWIHFGLTSEDVNNLAYALMLSDSLEQVMVPAIQQIVDSVNGLAKQYKSLPMLSRTHGQPASPTTFGKEFRVFASRLERRLEGLSGIKILAKLNGATGNWNAHVVAYPKVDWQGFSSKFIENFNKHRSQKLEANLITTQIESHDTYVAIFDTLRRINTILLDFNQDMWRYISDDWISQKAVAGEIGSSAMPHKVNPIMFENSEGNLGLANSLFEFFARKLPVSRLQRDLSDSTVERNIGVAFAHSLVAYKYAAKGLERVQVNEAKVASALAEHPEVIAEAIQTILRREGMPMPYELLKNLTRGKQVTMEDFSQFIDQLDVGDKIKQELHKITPENYIGLADKLA
jgi:adenylosuccinate lyase